MSRFLVAPVIIASLFLFSTCPAFAEDHDGEKANHSEEIPPDGYFEIGLFLGATTEINREEPGDSHSEEKSASDGAYGLELYYRGWKHFGVGFLYEFAGVDIERSNSAVLLLGYHPTKVIRLVIGPGYEQEDFEENVALLRVGAGYAFDIGKGWVLIPEFNSDFLEGGNTTLVYGATLAHHL